VLRPGGLLVISSPDRLTYSDKPDFHNPFHVKELYRDEFETLLGAHFKRFRVHGQRILFGSSIFPGTDRGKIVFQTLRSDKVSLGQPADMLGVTGGVEDFHGQAPFAGSRIPVPALYVAGDRDMILAFGTPLPEGVPAQDGATPQQSTQKEDNKVDATGDSEGTSNVLTTLKAVRLTPDDTVLTLKAVRPTPSDTVLRFKAVRPTPNDTILTLKAVPPTANDTVLMIKSVSPAPNDTTK